MFILGVLGLGTRYFLYDYTASVVGDLLFEFVKLRDNDRYTYSNKSIAYFPFERKLLITDLKIYPNSGIDTTATSYVVDIPSLYLDIESLWEVYWHKRLSITGVRMKDPLIEVNSIKKDADDSERIQLEAGELYKVISQYLRQLAIGRFDVRNGSISFSRNNNSPFVLNQFNLGIEEFSMDSVNLEERNNIFYTESIRLEVAGQEFELEESQRKFSFDSLIFSSRDSSFQLIEFKLYHDKEFDADDSISVRQLSFTGVDLNALYNEEVIDLGPLKIESPYVHLRTKSAEGERSVIRNTSKYRIIVDAVEVNNGSVAIVNPNVSMMGDNISLRRGRHHIRSGKELMDVEDFLEGSLINIANVQFSNDNLDLSADSLYLDGETNTVRLKKAEGSLEANNGHIVFNANAARVMGPLFSARSSISLDSIWLLDPQLRFEMAQKPDSLLRKKKKNVSVNYLSLASGYIELANKESFITLERVSGVAKSLSDTAGLENLKGLNLIGSISTILDTLYLSANWEYRGDRNLLVGHNIQTDFGDISNLRVSNLKPQQLLKKLVDFDSVYIQGSNIQLQLATNDSSNRQRPVFKRIYGTDNQLDISINDLKVNASDVSFSVLENLGLQSIATGPVSVEGSKQSIAIAKLTLPAGDRNLSVMLPEFRDEKNVITSDSVMINMAVDTLQLDSIQKYLAWIDNVHSFNPEVSLLLDGEKDTSRSPIILPPLTVENGKLSINGDQISLQMANVNTSGRHQVRVNEPNDWIQNSGGITGMQFSSNDLQFNVDHLTFLQGNIELAKASVINDLGQYEINSGRIGNLQMATFNLSEPVSMDTIILNGVALNLMDTTIHVKEKKPFGPVTFRSVQLQNADVTYTGTDQKVAINDISMQLDGLVLDTATAVLHILEANPQVNIGLASYDREFQDRTLETSDIQYDPILNILNIGAFRSTPKLSRDSFMLDKRYQSDWMDISSGKITIIEPDLKALLTNQGIDVQAIQVIDPRLTTYRDQSLEESPHYQSILPVKLLRSEIPVAIDSVKLENGMIFIEQKFPEVAEPARLSFYDINAKVKYIYSSNATQDREPNMLVYASGGLLENATFTSRIAFDMTDTLGNYTMKGKMKGGNLLVLNDMLEKAGHVRVNSGSCETVSFNFVANPDYAVGEMKFIYDDLNVTIMDNENRDEGFKSFVANAFVIHTRNPHFLFLRKGDIYAERKKNKEVFNYWANSILSGVVSSIGVRNNKKEIRRRNKESQRQFEN